MGEPQTLRAKAWLVTLTCCGRADGVFAADSWEEAQAFREAYTSGPGVSGGHVGDTGHDRSAVIHDALASPVSLTESPSADDGSAVAPQSDPLRLDPEDPESVERLRRCVRAWVGGPESLVIEAADFIAREWAQPEEDKQP